MYDKAWEITLDKALRRLVVAPPGSLVAISTGGSRHHRLQVLNAGGQEQWTRNAGYGFGQLQFSADGSRLLLDEGLAPGSVEVVDAANHVEWRFAMQKRFGQYSPAARATLSDDGTTVTAVFTPYMIGVGHHDVVRLVGGRVVSQSRGKGDAHGISASADGSIVAVLSGQRIQSRYGSVHWTRMRLAIYGPGGTTLADKPIGMDSGALHVSPDGARIAVAMGLYPGLNQTVVFDQQGKAIWVRKVDGLVVPLQFGPKGSLWVLENPPGGFPKADELALIDPSGVAELAFNPGEGYAASAISREGDFVAVALESGALRIFDAGGASVGEAAVEGRPEAIDVSLRGEVVVVATKRRKVFGFVRKS